jgi:hypothetical protein
LFLGVVVPKSLGSEGLAEKFRDFRGGRTKKRGARQIHKRPPHSRIKVNRTSLDHLLLDRDVDKTNPIINPFCPGANHDF